MSKDITERRKHERFDVNAGLSIDYTDFSVSSSRKERIEARTKNVSFEGTCFLSAKRFCPGEVVHLNLAALPDEEPIRIIGQVVWIRPTNKNDEKEAYETSVSLSLEEAAEKNRFADFVKSLM